MTKYSKTSRRRTRGRGRAQRRRRTQRRGGGFGGIPFGSDKEALILIGGRKRTQRGGDDYSQSQFMPYDRSPARYGGRGRKRTQRGGQRDRFKF